MFAYVPAERRERVPGRGMPLAVRPSVCVGDLPIEPLIFHPVPPVHEESDLEPVDVKWE